MSSATPARDLRVEKLRKLLRERSIISKEDFLDFVNVYEHFYDAGFKVRPTLSKWFQENQEKILEWRPDILRARPGFFDDVPPNSKSTFREYPILVSLGLAGKRSTEEALDGHIVSPRRTDLGVMPSQGKLKELSDFGSAIPESAVSNRPSLSGQFQQKVWLDDIKEIHHHLKQLRTWLIESANQLTPLDPMKDLMETASRRVPDFADHIRTAQICFDDVKSKYNASTAELLRGRARVKRYSPAPLEQGARERTATAIPDAEEGSKSPSASILVVSDIVGGESIPGDTRVDAGQPLGSGHGSTAGNAVKGPQIGRQSNGPRDNNPVTPLREIPRRSAMPLNTPQSQVHSHKRKFPGDGSSSDSSSGSDDSGSDDESFPDVDQIVRRASKRDAKSTAKAKSVYSIGSDNDAPPSAKRPRVVLGQARRPQNINGGTEM
ncbi:hypothetical protein B0T14DRAFT_553883 [Immersiella caudata]|uniref:Uncharacterized protein n=1 Tax=Immersiella caudata TaxID=314043 RepID=A0AA40C3B1_9PEZI|nr:hypothetical protein B0T14DRAFT_553883 [Immersiella caudata]